MDFNWAEFWSTEHVGLYKDFSMGDLESATCALEELELAQIYKGKCDEICSARVFLAHMPGDIKCLQEMNRPAAVKEQLQVFWYPESIPNQTQQRIKSVLLSMPESIYLGTFNLVQFWAPVIAATSDGLTRTFLSVSEQPFGADRICNGVCRYRYISVMNGAQVNESDPVGRAFMHHLPEFAVNVFEEGSFAKGCGFQSCWILPVVRGGVDGPPECLGVLEFLTTGDIRFDFTLVDKFQELAQHVIHALNSSFKIGIEQHMEPYDHNSNFADVALSSHPDAHTDFVQLHKTANDGFSPLLGDAITDHVFPTKENMRVKNAARHEISGSIIEELGSFLSANDDNNMQDTAQTTIRTRITGNGKAKIPEALIVEQFGKNIVDAADALGVSKSTLKRNCRHYHIQRWPPHKRNIVHPFIVKATYGASTVKFNIKSNIEIEVLHRELGKRFGLEVGSFRIEYKEEESGEQIMLPCTEDLKEHMNYLKSSKQKTMHLLVLKI